jgi:heat shock protein HtpX
MKISFDEVRTNKRKSILLFVMFFVLIGVLGVAVGFAFGNITIGVTLAVLFSIFYSLIIYSSGGSMILSITGAKEVTKAEYPHLFHAVEGLSIAAGLKKPPKCYVINDSALNAFATGKDPEHSYIAVTTGLLEKLNRQELEGVIAHEMSHIQNYDIRVMMLASVLVGVVILLSDVLLRSFLYGGARRSGNDDNKAAIIFIAIGLVLAILAPLIAQLIRLAISRKREYAADANAVTLTRYPKGLADALRKISGDPDPLVDNANKATAHLFISTPFRKKKGWFARMFSTHPPIQDRIKRLDQM